MNCARKIINKITNAVAPLLTQDREHGSGFAADGNEWIIKTEGSLRRPGTRHAGCAEDLEGFLLAESQQR